MTTSLVTAIPLDDIVFNEEINCRDKIRPVDIIDLAENIRKMGLIQPLVLREHHGQLHHVAGFRRYSALRRLGRTYADCIIHKNLSELDAAAINLVENIERSDLTPVEEAKAINKLLKQGYAIEEVCKKLNRSISWVEVRLAILSLPLGIQEAVAAGLINLKQVREIAELPENLQGRYVRAIKEKQERLKTAGLENLVKSKLKRISRTTKGRARNRQQIADVREFIYDLFGPCLEVALLSWAEGNITFDNVEVEIKKQTEVFGIPFKTFEQNSEEGYI